MLGLGILAGISAVGITNLSIFLDQSTTIQYDKTVLDENEQILPEYKGTWLFKEGQSPTQITP